MIVGRYSYEEVKKAVGGEGQLELDLFNNMDRIDQRARAVDQTFQQFRALQTKDKVDGATIAAKKAELRSGLDELRDELDRYLADKYELNQSKNLPKFKKWKESHQPFHWFVEFHGIIKRGGFDVIIGNPPYVEYSKIRENYKLLDNFSDYSTNLYSACCYRAVSIKRSLGYSSFIIPVSLPSTERMQSLRLLLTKNQ